MYSLDIKTDTGKAVVLGSNSKLYVTKNMDIQTTGDNATGITVNGSDDYSAGSGQIVTHSANVYDVYEKQDNAAINRTINFDVSAYGDASHALYFESALTDDLTVNLKSNLLSQGVCSYALFVNAMDNQNSNLNVGTGFSVNLKDDVIKLNASYDGKSSFRQCNRYNGCSSYQSWWTWCINNG